MFQYQWLAFPSPRQQLSSGKLIFNSLLIISFFPSPLLKTSSSFFSPLYSPLQSIFLISFSMSPSSLWADKNTEEE
jgi:hypothetical protein